MTDHKEFSFENISTFFDEAEYLTARELILIAAGLIEVTERNHEYERGMAEVITEAIGLPLTEFSAEVQAEIIATARDYTR